MSTRSDILTALRTDFNLTGNKKVWKSVKELNDISESDFPSFYVGFGTAVKRPMGDFQDLWEVPAMLVVYFSVKTDTDNSGKLETEAERLIGLYEVVEFTAMKALNYNPSIDLITVTPYVNTGVENKGFLLLEYKLTYIGS
jgi:hypothetical protein